MLVLTVKEGRTLKIGEVVTIKLLETRPGQVRIGIEAPEWITVLRDDARKRFPRRNAEIQSESTD